MKSPTCIFLLLILLMGTPCQAIADNAQSENSLTTLKGLKKEQITALIGQPDAKQEQGEGRETWTYGRSLILFSDGLVSGWSNAGELRLRRNLTRVKNPSSSEYDRYSTSWENDWTPQTREAPEEVIDDIMDEVEREKGGPESDANQDYSSKSKLSDDESPSTSSTVGKASSISSPP